MGAHPGRGHGRFYNVSHNFLVNVRGDEQMKTTDKEFEMLDRQLSGWRKRHINNRLEKDVYDVDKLFIESGWYSEGQINNLLKNHNERKNDSK